MKFIKFIARLIRKLQEDNTFMVANGLTYKLLLSTFPFLIFLMSLIGFFHLDSAIILDTAKDFVPEDAMNIIYVFINEVIDVQSPSILSSSLILTVWSASTGFNAVIVSINKAYGYEESRTWLRTKITSILLVLLFAVTIVCALFTVIFSDNFKNLFLKMNFAEWFINLFFHLSTFSIAIVLILFAVMLIYKFAVAKNMSLLFVLPGTFSTVTLWVIVSRIFNFYLSNFSNYSKVYGSIGGIFVLVIWLNLISFFLLLGGEINALIYTMIEEND